MHNLKPEKLKKSVLKKHSAFIRSLPCIARFFRPEKCEGKVQSCHVRDGFFCMGDKPQKAEVPMCAEHHRIQHAIGEKRFYSLLKGGVDTVKALALKLFEVSGDWSAACLEIANFRRK